MAYLASIAKLGDQSAKGVLFDQLTAYIRRQWHIKN